MSTVARKLREESQERLLRMTALAVRGVSGSTVDTDLLTVEAAILRRDVWAGMESPPRSSTTVGARLDYLQSSIVDSLPMGKPSDLVQGTLDLLILKTLALEPKHGWAIAKRIQQISRDVLLVQQGSLYPALHRLEQKGWIRGRRAATDTGRVAKFYSLTSAGRVRLEEESANWNRLSAAIDLVLQES